MSSSLEEALSECTLQLIARNENKGTGFFVAPRLLLTAAHVLAPAPFSPPAARRKSREYGTRIIYAGSPETADIALLEIQATEDYPWVSLRHDVRLKDTLFGFGYSISYPNGESLTLDYEGPVHEECVEYIKLKLGSVEPGMSGSPLLNLNTGSVVGMLVETRGRKTLLGGHAIGARTIVEVLPELARQQSMANVRRWRALVVGISGRSALDALDKTSQPTHYVLFPQDRIPVVEIYIEPNFQLVEFTDFTLSHKPIRTPSNNFLQEARSILERQKSLAIFGPYGCGKTILTKRLQIALETDLWDTCFINCAEAGDHLKEMETLVEQRMTRAADQKICLFFDGLDETHLLRREKADLTRRALRVLLQLSGKQNVFVVINSRLIPNFEEDSYLGICELLFDLFQTTTTVFLELKQFRDKDIDNWLDAHSNAVAKASQREGLERQHEERIYKEDLGKLHKRLRHACHNPLFLYVVARNYHAGGKAQIEEDIFTLYESFVDSTVLGKFAYEKMGGALAIQEIRLYYRQFLHRLAIEIAAHHEFRFKAEQQYGWTLDENQEGYGIPTSDIPETIWKIASTLLEEEVKEISKKRLASNVLSCYFLEEVDEVWRFRDNNILFFLLAEVMCQTLLSTIELNPAERLRSIQKIGKLHLHPLTLEILLGKLDREDRQLELRECLLSLFKEGSLLPAWMSGDPDSRQESLRLDVVAALVFLRINRLGYSDAPFFFEELESVARAARRHHPKLFDIVRSFLRRLHIEDATIEGQDLSGYNFSHSTLISTQLRRCLLIDLILDDATLGGVLFSHCQIEKTKAARLSGSAEFQHSDVDLEIINPGRERGLRLTFKRSQIHSLRIHNERLSESGDITIILEDCDADEVILRKARVTRLEIRRSKFPSLKLEGSDVGLLIDSESVCKAKKRVQADNSSRINVLPS